MAGDAIAFVTTLVDALVVVGGGIAAAHRLFLPSLVAEMNSRSTTPAGEPFRRLVQVVFNIEDPEQMEAFLRGRTINLTVPGSRRTVSFDALQRTGIGISRLGTSQAVAIGALRRRLLVAQGRGHGGLTPGPRERLPRQEAAASEPGLQQSGPLIEGRVAQPEAAAVLALREQVHFDRHPGLGHHPIERHARFDRHHVIVRRVVDERRRRLRGHARVG